MPFRQIYVPSLERNLSVCMAAPSSSAAADTHEAGLRAYHLAGGNSLHLHGEGGELHSRQAAGAWLQAHSLRKAFFLCTQICHDDWDESAQRSIDRFTPQAVRQDIAENLHLIGTDVLDMVYLDDRPPLPFEPVIEAVHREIASGRVRSFGVRNFTPERLRAAHRFAKETLGQGIAAVITTELSLFTANAPLWPEYIPFDAALQQAVLELGVVVLAHAGDLTLGQCLFGDAESGTVWRPEWVARWQHPDNTAIAARIQETAAILESTPRAIQMAWLLNQPFQVIAILPLPSFQTEIGRQYARGTQILLEDAKRLPRKQL